MSKTVTIKGHAAIAAHLDAMGIGKGAGKPSGQRPTIDVRWIRQRINAMRSMGARETGKDSEWSRGWNQAVDNIEAATLSDAELDALIAAGGDIEHEPQPSGFRVTAWRTGPQTAFVAVADNDGNRLTMTALQALDLATELMNIVECECLDQTGDDRRERAARGGR